MTIRVGDSVRQVLPAPIQGTVASKQFNEQADAFEFLVEGTSATGEPQSGWFKESEIEGV